TVPPDSWYGTLLKGVFNFQPDPTVLQVTVWLLYLVPTLALFLAPVGFASGKGKVKEPDEQGSRPSEAAEASKAPQAPQA
ncbi:iron transporter, partial [Streptomyces sp. NPDC004976]